MRTVAIALVACLVVAFSLSSASANLNRFAGKWENTDPKAGGLTRLEISVTGTKVKVHAYGDCEPADCDLGDIEGVAYAPSVDSNLTETAKAIIVKYADGERIMVIRPVEADRLQVETFTRFSDKSGRADYTAVYTFSRSD